LRLAEEIPAEVNALTTVAVGEKAEVAHAVEALRQHMEQEAPDELVWVKLHELLAAVATVILPSKDDVVVINGDDAAVGDGDAMSIAAKIGEHLFRATEGRLGIDDLVGPARVRETASESGWIVEMGKTVGEL
jgi:hypothetical protein